MEVLCALNSFAGTYLNPRRERNADEVSKGKEMQEVGKTVDRLYSILKTYTCPAPIPRKWSMIVSHSLSSSISHSHLVQTIISFGSEHKISSSPLTQAALLTAANLSLAGSPE